MNVAPLPAFTDEVSAIATSLADCQNTNWPTSERALIKEVYGQGLRKFPVYRICTYQTVINYRAAFARCFAGG